MSLHSYLLKAAADRPRGIALAGEDELHTYAALDRRSNGVAQRLLGCGVMPGERVVGVLDDTAASVSANQAILRTGATCVLMDRTLSPESMRAAILDCGPVVVLSPFAAAFGDAVLDAVRLVDGCILPAVDAYDDAGSEFVDVRSLQGDVAYLVYYGSETASVRKRAYTHGVITAAVDAIVVDLGDDGSEDLSALRFDIALSLLDDLLAVRHTDPDAESLVAVRTPKLRGGQVSGFGPMGPPGPYVIEGRASNIL